jgi:hypothetical protein
LSEDTIQEDRATTPTTIIAPVNKTGNLTAFNPSGDTIKEDRASVITNG